jgi:hypothetical protein
VARGKTVRRVAPAGIKRRRSCASEPRKNCRRAAQNNRVLTAVFGPGSQTDRKIHIHAFYCMRGISLLQYVHRQAKAAWSDLSMEQLIEEPQRIQQFILLYHDKARKALIARPTCYRSKLWRSRL